MLEPASCLIIFLFQFNSFSKQYFTINKSLKGIIFFISSDVNFILQLFWFRKCRPHKNQIKFHTFKFISSTELESFRSMQVPSLVICSGYMQFYCCAVYSVWDGSRIMQQKIKPLKKHRNFHILEEFLRPVCIYTVKLQ